MTPRDGTNDQSVDEWLAMDWPRPPADFHRRVIDRIVREEADAAAGLASLPVDEPGLAGRPMAAGSRKRPSALPIWQWLVLAAGVLGGIGQVTGFVFGIWTALAVG